MSIELVSVPENISLASNPVFFSIKGTQYSQENHSISATLYVENVYKSGTFEPIPEMVLNADDSGNAWINFSRILKKRVKSNLPLFEASTFSRCQEMVKRYKVVFKEFYGDPATEQNSKETAVFEIVKGEVNSSAFPNFSLISYLFSSKNYLSRQSEIRETWLKAKQYLYFMMPTAGANLNVKVKAYYSDGSTADSTPYQIAGALIKDIFCFPVSPDDLNLISSNKNLFMYEVWMVYASGSYSGETAGKKITYKIVKKPKTGRSFLFENKFGGFSTILTYRQDNKLQVERDENLKTLAPGYSPLSGDIQSEITLVEDEFEVITGPLPIREAEFLKEMLLSKEFYLIGRTAFVRCNLKGGTFSIVKESKDLYSVKFKYVPAFDQDLLASKLGLPVHTNGDYSDMYGNDYNV